MITSRNKILYINLSTTKFDITLDITTGYDCFITSLVRQKNSAIIASNNSSALNSDTSYLRFISVFCNTIYDSSLSATDQSGSTSNGNFNISGI